MSGQLVFTSSGTHYLYGLPSNGFLFDDVITINAAGETRCSDL